MKLLGLDTYDIHTFVPKLLSLFFDANQVDELIF